MGDMEVKMGICHTSMGYCFLTPSLFEQIHFYHRPTVSETVNFDASIRTRGQPRPPSPSSGQPGSLGFSDLGKLLRGSADILDNNGPRLEAIAAQAQRQG